MTKEWFELLNKYAEWFAVNPQDVDDIVSEACLLYVAYPPDTTKLTKSFFYQLANWGRSRFLDRDKRFREMTVRDHKKVKRAKSSVDTEAKYYEFELRTKLRSPRILEVKRMHGGLSPLEKKIFTQILEDTYKYQNADRTHFDNLKKKLNKLVN